MLEGLEIRIELVSRGRVMRTVLGELPARARFEALIYSSRLHWKSSSMNNSVLSPAD